MKKCWLVLVVASLFLSGCASVQFPKLGSAPERPSVKSNWKESHVREVDFAALFAAMKEFEKTGVMPKVVVVRETDEFGVDHSDTRKAAANPFAVFFTWVLGLGGLGVFLWLGGGSLIVFLIGVFVKKFFELRKALYQTVAGIKASGLATEKGSALHTALESSQDEPVKKLVKDIRNKVKV